jgi:alcohol dehydrogenase-like protein
MDRRRGANLRGCSARFSSERRGSDYCDQKYRNMRVCVECAFWISSLYTSRSDIHFWHAGCIGPMIVKDNHVLGHESSGIVIAVHPSVTSLRVGDRVAIEPNKVRITRSYFYLHTRVQVEASVYFEANHRRGYKEICNLIAYHR